MNTRDNPTYLVGDRVRTTRETWGDDLVPVGAVGTIIQAPPLLAVSFDHDPVGDGTGCWAISAYQLAHLGRTPKARARLRRRYGPPALLLCALTGFTPQHQESM